MKDALELLRNDHVAARGLVEDLEDMSGKKADRKKKMHMLSLIEREVKIHTALEEKLVYPAFRGAARTDADRRLFREVLHEHHEVDALFPALKVLAPTHEPFLARLREVKKVLLEHIRVEETKLFPRLRELLGPEGIGALGERITQEKGKELKSWSGMLSGPAHRVKSLVDKLTPASVKRGAVAARSARVLRELRASAPRWEAERRP